MGRYLGFGSLVSHPQLLLHSNCFHERPVKLSTVALPTAVVAIATAPWQAAFGAFVAAY